MNKRAKLNLYRVCILLAGLSALAAFIFPGEPASLGFLLVGLTAVVAGYSWDPGWSPAKCLILALILSAAAAWTGLGARRYYGAVFLAAAASLVRLDAVRRKNSAYYSGIRDESRRRLRSTSGRLERVRRNYGILEGELKRMSRLYDLSREMEKVTDPTVLARKALESLSLRTGIRSLAFFEKKPEGYTLTGRLGRTTGKKWLSMLDSGKGCVFFFIKVGDDELGRIGVRGEMSVTERKNAELLVNQITLGYEKSLLYERVRQLSRVDGLTGLYLRRYFFERLSEEIRMAKRDKQKVGFIMADIDNFKEYNDTYGHLAGDKLLKKISSIIKRCVYTTDIAGRYGGEEFCVFMPKADREGTLRKAEKIIRAADEETPVSISAGVAFFPDNADSGESLVELADNALYGAKKEGKNRVRLYTGEDT